MPKKTSNKLVKMNMERHMVITPVFRVSFPQLFTPKAFEDSEKTAKSFSVEMIFDDRDLFKEPYKGKKTKTPSMMKVVTNAKVDQWGPNKEKWPKFNYPVFKRGEERVIKDTQEVYEEYVDKWFVSAKSDERFPPKIVSKSGTPLEEKDVYGGCYARAQLVARPYMFGKNFGVRFLLFQLLKERDGERFGGVPDDVFDLSEEDEDEDLEDFDESDESDDDEDL